MMFKKLEDLILHSYQTPIPVDVKIGDRYASIKIYRSGKVYIKWYVPEREFTIDVSGMDTDDMIEKHISKNLIGELKSDTSVVAVLNSKVCTIRKIKNHTILVCYIKARFEFPDEDTMNSTIEAMTKMMVK